MAVLIADNDRAVSGLLTDVLAQSGIEVVHAFDGDAARQMAQHPAVQVLVCDLDMPGASGLEVLEDLDRAPSPPRAIVISGYLDARIEARLRALPFVQEVFRKPFDLLVFAAVVRRVAQLGGRYSPPEGQDTPGQQSLPHSGPERSTEAGDEREDGGGPKRVAVEH